MKLLIEAREIPDNATVSKRTGDKKYTLSRTLKIYNEGAEPTVINADANTVFIQAGISVSINAINAETLLHWHVREEDLAAWLEKRYDERNDQ